MASSPSTMGKSSPAPLDAHPALDLSTLPPIYVLPTHLPTDELHEIEDQIRGLHGQLTYDMHEARIVLGKITSKKRAELELRIRKVATEEHIEGPMSAFGETKTIKHRLEHHEPPRKKQKMDLEDGSTTEDESSDPRPHKHRLRARDQAESVIDLTQDEIPAKDVKDADMIQVVKLQWLHQSVLENTRLEFKPYVIYQGRFEKRPLDPKTPTRKSPVVIRTSPREAPKSQNVLAEKPTGSDILERARADAGYGAAQSQDPHTMAAPHGTRKMGARGGRPVFRQPEPPKPPAKLMDMETEDFEGGSDQEMPPPPDWVKQNLLYACQRSTPFDQVNEEFIEQLKKIRLARILTNDEIGVRAYSTSIASLAAYPYKISNPREILRLPGCDTKVANLWIEWKNSGGTIKAAEEAENDPTLKILNHFYEIWGVGATTAREFYFEKGWTELDDIVDYGWDTLNRVQQIGVKYYEEFQRKIPRSEVESIANKVKEHAIKVRDDGIEIIVVGGYRRGKKESGDVDMIVSHRDLEKTAGLVSDIVESLEQEGWITHTLTLSLTTTDRNQSTLPFKTNVGPHGSGFDTLDKALVVWQDPVWPNMEQDLKNNPKAKNPNIHRRVDIIISPWRTVGCAVLGWTSGTTFQRDLRRYARSVKGWKFDSSGIRDRSTGEVVEVEGPEGVSGSMADAEKNVFEGFGLTYREPWERCTG